MLIMQDLSGAGHFLVAGGVDAVTLPYRLRPFQASDPPEKELPGGHLKPVIMTFFASAAFDGAI